MDLVLRGARLVDGTGTPARAADVGIDDGRIAAVAAPGELPAGTGRADVIDLDTLDATPKRLNVGAMIGHTPLRLYVLGDDATERAATDDEVARMHDIVREAIDAGAIGFATSKSPTHSGAWGKPVPSRLAEKDEVFRIAAALKDAGRGIV